MKSSYIVFFIFCGVLRADEKMTQFLPPESCMIHQLPACLQGKPVYHIKTLAVQKDRFSCGYHAIFNAVALDKAVYEDSDFVYGIKKNLNNTYLFYDVCAAIKKHIGVNQPLNGAHIEDIAKEFPLGERLLSLFFQADDIMIPRLAVNVEHPLTMPKSEIEKLLKDKQNAIVQEKIKQLIDDVATKRRQAAHFICNIGNHYILCTVISDYSLQTKLYVIGAWNEPINDAALKYINLFLSFMKI